MKRNLIPFDQRHASPSYQEFGTGKPKCRKERLPIKIISESKSPNREQRREQERTRKARSNYFAHLGEKHKTRLAKAGVTS